MATAVARLSQRLRHVTNWDLAVAVASGLLALVTLVELTADMVEEDEVYPVDERISNAVLDMRTETLTDWMSLITRLAHTETVVIVVVMGAIVAFRRSGRPQLVGVLICSLATTVAVSAMKELIGRERPLPPIGLSNHDSASYPSGHSAYAVAVWGALLWVMCSGGSNTRKAIGALVALTIAVSVGVTRVYLGAHWASDVIAGWAVGGICLSLGVLAAALIRSTVSPADPVDEDDEVDSDVAL